MSTAFAEAPRDARIDLRMTSEARATIAEAASLNGSNLTDYILGVVLPAARRDVLETKTIRLSRESWDAFIKALDEPDPPAMQELRAQTPPWGKWNA